MTPEPQTTHRSESLITWCLLGFGLSYVLFFLRPTFGHGEMRFPVYVPAIDPIGWDLIKMLTYVREMVIARNSPYIMDNLYPPMAMLVFTPLTLLDGKSAYCVTVACTILSFVVVSLVLPIVMSGKQRPSLLVASLFLLGLFSYGLQFEIERGQFNLVAMALALVAVFLFHYRAATRPISYVLLLLSIQLKLYPLMLLPLFVDNWRAWKTQLVRIGALAAASLACTLALGPRVFLDFVHAVSANVKDPQVWIGNHSIASFARQALPSEPQVVVILITGMYGACLGYSLVRSIRASHGGVDPLLLLVCTAGALLLPAISHDYTLPLLAGPMAVFVDRAETSGGEPWRRITRGALLSLMVFAYCSIQFPYVNRGSVPWLDPYVPSLLTQNALPYILVLTVSGTLLTALASNHPPSARLRPGQSLI